MNRIYSIDLLKMIFAYLIAFSHFGINLPGEKSAVVFFFILSGYFLARKFYVKKEIGLNNTYDGFSYTVDHIKTLYPHYILSLIILWLYLLAKEEDSSLYTILEKTYDLLPEIFMMQNSGFYEGGINYPLWQVCALVIGGYFVYTLLHLNEKISIKLIFPLSVLTIRTFLSSGVDPFGKVGFLYIPLLRAFCALAIGVLIYRFSKLSFFENEIKKHTIAWNVISTASLILLFVFDSRKNIYLILSVFIIIALMQPESWINKCLNKKIFRYCGDFSYAIYLNHALIIYFIDDYKDIFLFANGIVSEKYIGILYGLILTIYSVATTVFVNFFKRKMRDNKK